MSRLNKGRVTNFPGIQLCQKNLSQYKVLTQVFSHSNQTLHPLMVFLYNIYTQHIYNIYLAVFLENILLEGQSPFFSNLI